MEGDATYVWPICDNLGIGIACPSCRCGGKLRETTESTLPAMRLPIIIALASLVACAEFPQLDGTIDAAARAASYPTLQPLAPLLANAASMQTTGQFSDAANASFDARVAQLQNRAARLRGPVIDAATRAKMRRGVAVPAAIR